MITRDLDGDELRVSSIRINEDGVRLSEPALSIDSIGRISFNTTTIDEERRISPCNPYHREYFNYFNDTTSTIRTGRISTSNLRNNTSSNNFTSGNLVFLDMKVENLGDQFKTTITYIDKKNYQEVKREYFSNVSFTQEFNISGDNKLNIEVEQYGEIKEIRKDI